MTIGERIKNRRVELGLSVDTIAAKLSKNRATIYRYESDDIENLPTTVLEPLAEILQTTPAHLMGWDEDVQKEKEFHAFLARTEDKLRLLARHLDEIPEENRERIIKNFEDTIDLYLSVAGNKVNKKE